MTLCRPANEISAPRRNLQEVAEFGLVVFEIAQKKNTRARHDSPNGPSETKLFLPLESDK
jgi:hypothetical protein